MGDGASQHAVCPPDRYDLADHLLLHHAVGEAGAAHTATDARTCLWVRAVSSGAPRTPHEADGPARASAPDTARLRILGRIRNSGYGPDRTIAAVLARQLRRATLVEAPPPLRRAQRACAPSHPRQYSREAPALPRTR
jgi:hypothetical protein